MTHLQSLEVILKTVERCNINCSYCYFFHGEDQSYKKHPPFILSDVIENLVSFIRQGVQDFDLKKVQIDLHGGEPTLQNKAAFDKMCQHFRVNLDPLTDLTIALQTNGTLINEDWIKLFSKHNIYVGVSIDGPEHVHDRFRLDHKGFGTYQKTLMGVRMLQEAVKSEKIQKIAALCVINPENNAYELYNHVVHNLGIDQMDFLLPDNTYETFRDQNPEAYGKFLSDLFNAWTSDDNPEIHIRILNSALSLLVGGPTYLKGFGPGGASVEAITVSSNGDLSPDDSLRFGIPHLMGKYNILETSLKEFLSTPIMQEMNRVSLNSPDSCKSCCWEAACGGNAIISRYKEASGFNNPSVYCSGLKQFYGTVASYLLNNGVEFNELKQVLIKSKDNL